MSRRNPFSTPRFSPWQMAALIVAKKGGTMNDVASEIRVTYPEYSHGTALSAASRAVETLERKQVLRRTDGRLAIATDEVRPDQRDVQKTEAREEETCEECDGDGLRDSIGSGLPCRTCHGTGSIIVGRLS